ncbi:MAG: hypothetical protein K2W97_08345 [Chthoniobacterales bacterium]|nr:hypothetical protein [Chthoniobacterales bacterium]
MNTPCNRSASREGASCKGCLPLNSRASGAQQLLYSRFRGNDVAAQHLNFYKSRLKNLTLCQATERLPRLFAQ